MWIISINLTDFTNLSKITATNMPLHRSTIFLSLSLLHELVEAFIFRMPVYISEIDSS